MAPDAAHAVEEAAPETFTSEESLDILQETLDTLHHVARKVDLLRAGLGHAAAQRLGADLIVQLLAAPRLMLHARELSFDFFGWTFAFYMAAQGSLIIYVVIIWYYARYMNRLDREYDVHEGEDE